MKAMLLAVLVLAASPARAAPEDRWAGMVAEAAARFAMPEVWIRRVMAAESGGRATRGGRPLRSRAGAMGLMQLMPATWREMRAAHGLGPDPDDPHDNIMAGAAYLRAMYDRFGYPGLFGAYNAGPRRYAAYLATGRPLPRETTAYMAALAGFAVPPSPSASRPVGTGLIFMLHHGGSPARSALAPAREDGSGTLFVHLSGADPD